MTAYNVSMSIDIFEAHSKVYDKMQVIKKLELLDEKIHRFVQLSAEDQREIARYIGQLIESQNDEILAILNEVYEPTI